MTRQILSQALLSLAVGCAVALVLSEAALGTPEIARAEQQGCLVCHTAVGKADLNDLGRYYRAERTLEGYERPESAPEPDRREPADEERTEPR
jgi:hypothetical protein